MNNRKKYLKSKKKDKAKILNMLVEQTGYHRKSLIRSLNKTPSLSKRGGSKSKYTENSIKILQIVWESMDFICAELLHPSILDILSFLKGGKLKDFPEKDIELIKNIPLGTLKAKLRNIKLKKGHITNYYRRSKSNLKKSIPVCVDMNRSAHSGFIEVDFVDHMGGDASGKYVRTLCAVDVYTQMVNRRATRGKIEESVKKVCTEALDKFPFDLCKIHSDNEASLLNSLIYQQASQRGLKVSRSRPYRKEDNGHVEQKNGNKIRGLVGYRRYSTDEHVNLLNDIYFFDDLFQNHFIPSMRLKEKVYNNDGKLVKKIYDKPKTPYQRILNDNAVPKKVKDELETLHNNLNPIELKANRDKLVVKLRAT